MNTKSADGDQYRKREAQQRFEAALRGARAVGHQPMSSMTPKGKPSQQRDAPSATGAKKKKPSR